MTIYFNKMKDACAFEPKEPIASVDDATWLIYSQGRKEVDWDIIDGKFVKLVSEDELNRRLNAEITIQQLKINLDTTDYQAIKFSDGAISEEEYAPIRAQRQAWRDEINELEKLL